jgi:hypothetical protein
VPCSLLNFISPSLIAFKDTSLLLIRVIEPLLAFSFVFISINARPNRLRITFESSLTLFYICQGSCAFVLVSLVAFRVLLDSVRAVKPLLVLMPLLMPLGLKAL